ncbi:DUF3040 domain-containing protein [Actinomycetospora sp. TBRC 11914]|uniref:DUF3040 domain-containing protein n=1 Tax=Actinomycetospora sp. TBRC 11914 TaxID=2729387 RepID=UPI00145CD51C|nr:DUF3040 domain-containing protein [Actinomycetospora sp. TBRC 11914]NMO93928.1 DUF3040 domain-containing protein [Actinomycetospora sp. TBRC 11914]
MSDHRAAPLSADEARVLRAVAQDLTRSGADVLRDPDSGEPAVRPRLVELGIYLLAIGVVASALTLSVGPMIAIVVGAGLLVVATIKAATSAPPRAPLRR